ncbi:MAG: signal peptidase I [Spirochaetaceae bacterium]|jgi:signal peptidase I|nr:signal peptidase I [Spirochaetaceae bacterium]
MADKKLRQQVFFDSVQSFTEAYLSRRRRIQRIKREKQQKKNPIIDWIEAFVWAACVVLLINQYLFQAYQIPSGSMVDTLLIGDRIFVNKLIYGPELLPGLLKLDSPIKPKRNDIIIFENPSYNSRGTAFDVAQRIIYMLTISLVDIDRDQAGNPKAHFLIKRAVGMGGDCFYSRRGEMFVRFNGEDRVVSERDYNEQRGWKHNITRLVDEDSYPAIELAGVAAAWIDLQLTPTLEMFDAIRVYNELRYNDLNTFNTYWLETNCAAFPHEDRYSEQLARRVQGWYIPANYILPLGDNRDNSHDGRYFGPVRISKILGKGAFIYWPLWPPPGRAGFLK